jgi:hypothetical protein
MKIILLTKCIFRNILSIWLENYTIFISVSPKLTSDLNQWLPTEIIMTIGKQTEFFTIDPKRGEKKFVEV